VLARNIKAARLAREWSQETLAKRLKVSRVAVTMWEAGGYSPSLPNLQKIARLFGVSVDVLLTGRVVRKVAA
jgi:transcriptional regulator with XRE-family HTH domain